LQKLPYILVVGDKEKAAGAVAVRARGNQDLGVMSLDAFAQLIRQTSPTRLISLVCDACWLSLAARPAWGVFATVSVAQFLKD
jgi:hypothetical protein